MVFKKEILETQKKLKKLYATEIERVGGINIWEKMVGSEKKKE